MKNRMLDTQKIYERLMQVTSSKKDANLAVAIGISHQSFYSAKIKGRIPPSWIIEVSQKYNVSSDYIFFGIGKSDLELEDVNKLKETIASLQQENANLKQDLDMYRNVIKNHKL